ncbi:lytic transglycosylase domain-containing protein [Salmonella enterica]|uniref:Lytic transglycosylase n=7 Tax=Salmonella enterica TaxID=28901 RepID=A0A5Y2DR60_SALMU|nr:lytic transglycosylase domain-containing protein [Salmonella enterica]EAA1730949.1 lytic transglycosylase [Salmonella enterica subsp. enterica serovar Oranienburg]EAA1754443.1 lytic transglycosylase [Salmonella enterica subsp. enterica serovar Sundsvall]EAA2694832.1 lytic transglycosylase [Salmonella enterica subsp. enterica serovar Typhimurium]EAA5369825.1 lytic transglycosylase [Salmonella enterica subsp. arizonae]EAA5436650.1 lytic transglycosylase [Salmonella enterica subsp. enterica se
MHTLRLYISILIIIPFFGFAAYPPIDESLNNCFNQASKRFQIDHRLLIAIAEVESNMNSKAIGLNKRGGKIISEDIGIMQINSSWLPTLVGMGITRNDLLHNPCQNIYVGAWILAQNISSNGVNWESVGAYNAGFKGANAPFRMKYAKKVYAKYIVLTGEK